MSEREGTPKSLIMKPETISRTKPTSVAPQITSHIAIEKDSSELITNNAGVYEIADCEFGYLQVCTES